MDVVLNDYKVELEGGNDKWESRFVQLFNEKFSDLGIDLIDIYNMDGKALDLNAGNKKSMVVILNGHNRNQDKRALPNQLINNEELVSTTFLEPFPDNYIVESIEGIPIAEYNVEYNELYILFNLSENQKYVALTILEYILDDLNENIFNDIRNQNSWIKTNNKEDLIKEISEQVERKNKNEMEEKARQIRRNEERIKNYTHELNKLHQNNIRYRHDIELVGGMGAELGKKVVKELDLIASLEKIKDIKIENRIIELYTNDLYMYSDEDKRYYLGQMRIIMDIEQVDFRFYNLNNTRRSYWSGNDSHPHVNGDNGEACLGNVASTIAELSSRYELYALALTLIDFLENANTQDPAGANVVQWDEVDEDGNIIREGGDVEPEWDYECDSCGEFCTHDNDGGTTVFNGAERDSNEDIMLYGESEVCDTCLNEHYHFNDETNEYIADDSEVGMED